jgi:ParB family chromosome partitioning protein
MALLDDSVKDEVLASARSVRKSSVEHRIEQIPLSKIRPNPGQPRNDFTDMDELIASVREKGILQPLLVRRKDDGFQIIAGERRYRAAKELRKDHVPAVIIDADEQSAFEIAIIENIQRKNLSPLEEAQAYQALIDRFGLTHDQVSQRMGRDRSTITNSLRLLSLPEEVRKDVSRGTITAGHAKILVGLRDRDDILRWSRRVRDESLSVRQLEHLISSTKEKSAHPAKTPTKSDVFLRDFENRLEEIFSTKVRIKGTNRKGRITIEYYKLEDLERIRKVCERAAKK